MMLTNTIEKMVEVFRTNVQETMEAGRLCAMLQRIFPGARVTLDLEDCDRVLRLEGEDIAREKVMSLFSDQGFNCAVLE